MTYSSVKVDEGSDKDVATDLIASKHHQCFKAEWGAEGAANPVEIGANAFPVQENNSAAIKTAVELIDDAVATGGSATPAKGLLAMGSDGTSARPLKMDSNGRPSVDVNSLPAIPTGTNTIGKLDQGAAGASAWPVKTESQTDYDTGAGTSNLSLIGLALPGSGGPVAGGSASNPFRTDPTGTTTQPVSLAASIPTGDNVIGRFKMTDGSNVASILNLTNSKPLTVAIVDGSGNQITSFGGGSGGTAQGDKSGFTEGSGLFTPMGGVYNETISADPSEDQAAAARITAKRALHSNLRDASGNEIASATGTPGGSDRGIVVRNIPSGTQTVDTELPAAAALADGASNPTAPIVGAAGLLYNGSGWDRMRGDTSNGLDVDVTRLPALPTGANVIGALSANQSVNLSQMGGNTVNTGTGNAGTGTQRVVLASDQPAVPVSGTFWQTTQPISGTVTASNTAGDVAHDGADSGNPVKTGGRAVNAEPSAVANNDRANFITDLVGKQIVLPYANPENFLAGKTSDITGTSDTAVIAAQGAGVRIYVTALSVMNSHASTGTWVNIKDGSTIIHTGYAAAGGGGFVLPLPTPLRLTANTALNAACETTGANVRVSAVGYKGV